MRFQKKHVGALTAVAVAAAAVAGTLIQLSAPVVVSQSDAAHNAYKAKMGWIAYKSSLAASGYDVRAQLLVYADGPAGKQNIYVVGPEIFISSAERHFISLPAVDVPDLSC